MMSERLRVTVGTLARTALLEELESRGVGLNPLAGQLLDSAGFDAPEPLELGVGLCEVSDLGLVDGGTWPEILDAAVGGGWGLLPLEAAPYLRLALWNLEAAPDAVLSAGRAPHGAVHVLSAAPAGGAFDARGFYLRTVEGRRWLRGFCCDDEYVFESTALLALALPAAEPGEG